MGTETGGLARLRRMFTEAIQDEDEDLARECIDTAKRNEHYEVASSWKEIFDRAFACEFCGGLKVVNDYELDTDSGRWMPTREKPCICTIEE